MTPLSMSRAALGALCTTLSAALALAGCPLDPPPPPEAGDEVDLAQPAGFDADIRAADAEDLDPAADVVEVALEARVVSLDLQQGGATEVWSYNGGVPGPTLRARAGDRVVVRFHNALPEPTTIHWHGLRVVAAMDGVGPVVQPGEDFVYELDVPDAGTFWYHPHVDSSAQLGRGLHGAFIVEEALGEEHAAQRAFGDDVVLVVTDMSIDEEGALRPLDENGWFGDFFGREGNVALVNGRVLPTLRAYAGVPQRWRIVNASRSRYQRFALPAHGLTHIAVDGGLLDRAVPDAEVVLPPGARADLVFVAQTPGETIDVDNLGFDRVHAGGPPRGNPLFRVEVDGRQPVTPPAVPAVLRTIEALDVDGAREQVVVFNTALQEDGTTATAINGELGHDGAPFHADANSVEVWTLQNTTALDHPFHLHGFFFQVLSVDGEAPARRGWLDTINVPPRANIRIAPVFDDRAGTWMFHCHILDHAEMGMMRTLIVGDADAHDAPDEHDDHP